MVDLLKMKSAFGFLGSPLKSGSTNHRVPHLDKIQASLTLRLDQTRLLPWPSPLIVDFLRCLEDGQDEGKTPPCPSVPLISLR